MPDKYLQRGLGRLPSPQSFRDFRPETPEIKSMLAKNLTLNQNEILDVKLSTSTSFRDTFPSVRDQLDLGSCVTFSIDSVLGSHFKQRYKVDFQISTLFLYKLARHMMGWTGDTGLFIKSGFNALRHFGVPKESDYPYKTSQYENMPTWDIGAIAQNYQALKYFRLDALPYTQPESILARVKTYLSKKYPISFGFNCYDSLFSGHTSDTGEILFPQPSEAMVGGHAICICGYDDNKMVGDKQGAFEIRNSWGLWGDDGYGWLPYEYLLQKEADEFTVLIKQEWLDPNQ